MSQKVNFATSIICISILTGIFLKDDVWRGYQKFFELNGLDEIIANSELLLQKAEVKLSTIKEVEDKNGICEAPSSALCGVFKDSSTQIYLKDNSVEYSKKKQDSLQSAIDEISLQIAEIGRESTFHPQEILHLQFIILSQKSAKAGSKYEEAKKIQTLVEFKRSELEQMFKLVNPFTKLKISYVIRPNKFKKQDYTDSSIIQKYEEDNQSWRLTSKFIKNINILVIPGLASNDLQLVEYKKNYVCSSKNLLETIKRIAFEQSGVKKFKDYFSSINSDILKFTPKSLIYLVKRTYQYNTLKEIVSLLKTVNYVENNWDLRFKDSVRIEVEELLVSLNSVDLEHINNNSGLISQAFRLNRQVLYDTVYMMAAFRYCFYGALILVNFSSLFFAIYDESKRIWKEKFSKEGKKEEKIEIGKRMRDPVLVVIDEILSEAMFIGWREF